MNLVGQVAPKDGKFEINSPRPNHSVFLRTVREKAPSNGHYSHVHHWLTIIGKDAESAGGQSTTREKRQRRTGMALKVELKPHERIIIGACVVTNTDQRARLLIDGDRIPILREKDILTPETADTPAKLVYLAVQLMYLSPDPMAHHPTYFSLVRDILTAMPSAWPFIEGINNYILNGDLYHALKESKKLIGHEEQILESARKMQALDEPDRKSA
jgi:flagellar biosynthesis repressor protein FlbT